MILVNGLETQSIPAWDRGLAYGDGVFRTLRVRDGVPQHWPRHYRKLASDCAALDLRCPDPSALDSDIARATEHSGDAVLKIIVTRGASERGYRYHGDVLVNRMVMVSAPPPRPTSLSMEGVRVRRCRLKLAHQPALAGVKHLNRLENVLARAEWTDEAIGEGLLCDVDGCVIGGTMTNLFAVFGSELATPKLTRCGVAGVTRERVIDAALQNGVTCRVRDLSWAELLAADELFLVNSLCGVWPVRQLEERTWAPGPVARTAERWIEV